LPWEVAPFLRGLPHGGPGVNVARTMEAGQPVVADGHGPVLGPSRLAPLYRPGGLGWVAAMLVGAVVAVIALVLLSLSLSNHTRSELMSARSVMLQGVVDEFVRGHRNSDRRRALRAGRAGHGTCYR
jgi:hypothetical protein